jgi:hypothetical protein
MTLASTIRRIAALESAAVPVRGCDFPTYTPSAADMARLRLQVALDAALRGVVPSGQSRRCGACQGARHR